MASMNPTDTFGSDFSSDSNPDSGSGSIHYRTGESRHTAGFASVRCGRKEQNPSADESATRLLSRRRILQLVWCLVLSFFLMLLLTRSSFLYPYNNWDDSNSYFSMGKSMFRGTLIYRDLFDQKGPYLYFLYGLCSLVSRTTFLGVFLMEVLWGGADLYLLQRIMELYCRRFTAKVLSPILFACMCASKSFYWGGCAEELCLPFLLATLYILLRRFRASSCPADAHFRSREVFAAGLCCGYVFCVKFTLMGFFLAFALLVILTCRSGKEFFRLAGAFLAGIVLPFLPWILYFAVRGGLADWYRVYIYTNVFLYSDFGANSHGADLGQRIYDLAKILYWLVLDNFQYFLWIIAGILWTLLKKGSSLAERIAPALLFGCTFLFIYIGGAHLPYYAFPLTALSVIGMSGFGVLLDRVCTVIASRKEISGSLQPLSSDRPAAGRSSRLPLLPAAAMTAALALSFLVILRFSWNIPYLGTSGGDVFLTKFTEDINNDRAAGLVDPENTTLLNIGCLDSGLYTTADIYPSCYWFQTQTLPGDEVTRQQLSYITEGRTDYIVARDSYPEEVLEQYELIDSFHQELQPQAFDYYLFRRKDLVHRFLNN